MLSQTTTSSFKDHHTASLTKVIILTSDISAISLNISITRNGIGDIK